MATFAVILPAAGKSSRFGASGASPRGKTVGSPGQGPGSAKKPFAEIDGQPVWVRAIQPFLARDDVVQTLIVIAREDEEMFRRRFGPNIAFMGTEIVFGGKERFDSVAAALARVKADVDFVAVHDAARPCIVGEWLDPLFAEAGKTGAAILALPLNETLKRVGSDKKIAETVPREGMWLAQTPQVFRRQLLLDAYANAGGTAGSSSSGSGTGVPPVSITDDAQLVEALGVPVSVVKGSPLNVKITTRADLKFAAAAMKALPKPKVSGPAHPFAEDDMWR